MQDTSNYTGESVYFPGTQPDHHIMNNPSPSEFSSNTHNHGLEDLSRPQLATALQAADSMQDLSHFQVTANSRPHSGMDHLSASTTQDLSVNHQPDLSSTDLSTLGPQEPVPSTAMSPNATDLTEEGKSKSQPQDAVDVSAQVASPRYNPADLMSPRSKRHRDATATEQDSTAENATPAAGMGSFMERLHNVGDREAAPVSKKRKLDGEMGNSTFKTKKGGVIGDYLKEQRDKAVQSGPQESIDLTADDDEEDDVQIVASKSTAQDPNREVCLGAISAKVMAHKVPAANKILGKHTENWPICKMTLRPTLGQERVFAAIDAKGTEFGRLDNISASAIAPLLKAQQVNKLRFITFLKERRKDPGELPQQTISKSLDISITLYCAAHAVQGIGRHLSKRQIFLYKPTVVAHDTEIVNPHVPNIKVVPTKGNASASIPAQVGFKTRTTEEIRNDVMSMFDRLGEPEDLPKMEADSSLVLTELLPHQKQALGFLVKHETPTPPEEDPLWKYTVRKNGSRAWYHVITGDELKKVDSVQGGILADMMGLGKTLSILSLICATINEAKEFGKAELDIDGPNLTRNTKATLLVCPKSVISNWQEQIKTHLDNHKIKYYMYHGTNRQQDVDELAKFDVVITSYTIVASEFSSTSRNYTALSQLAWFRIVLDEAHQIRNQDTTTFKAACALVGKRRWAVTGTPVQNRLDDFGALIKFLNIYPFAEKGKFEKHFNGPLKAGDQQAVENLSLFVKSITLRRYKDKIDLPNRTEEIVRLKFSDEEYALYDAFARDAGQKVRAMTRGNDRLRGRSYAHVLQNITRLRLLCAHGRELLGEEDMKLLQGSSYETAIDLGEESDADKPVMTEEAVYENFLLLRDSTMDVCTCCTETIGRNTEVADDSDSDSEDEDEDKKEDIIGYMTPCYHLICPRCVDGFWKQLEETRTADNYCSCPQCQQYIKMVVHPVSQKGLDEDIERRQKKRRVAHSKKGVEYRGPHTKVKALLADLQQYAEESRALAELGEPPIRSVIFSGWTAYLDLIEIALKSANIGFLRLDGKMSVSARTHVMNQFKTDPSISVIIVSIKAGGQGLNFTAANKVYMMEPQFNPGVEMQAADRVHRLGQKRDVTIRRFIMANSFEEKIVELQRKKIELANLATGKKEQKRDPKEVLKDLMSLF